MPIPPKRTKNPPAVLHAKAGTDTTQKKTRKKATPRLTGGGIQSRDQAMARRAREAYLYTWSAPDNAIAPVSAKSTAILGGLELEVEMRQREADAHPRAARPSDTGMHAPRPLNGL